MHGATDVFPAIAFPSRNDTAMEYHQVATIYMAIILFFIGKIKLPTTFA